MRNISENEDSENCYFNDLEEILKSHADHYISLSNELNRLDDKAWEFLKNELKPELCNKNPKRGWTQLFNKLNEARGYGYLLSKGLCKVGALPVSHELSTMIRSLGRCSKVRFC